ncbi:MAG: alpha/beta fold hydrolase [Verrucomicrobiota bacterium]
MANLLVKWKMKEQCEWLASEPGEGRIVVYRSERFDRAKVVLMLHGLGDNWHCHRPAAAIFESLGYSWIGFDWPGHGNSEGRRGDIPGVDEAHEIIDEVLAKFGIEDFCLYAHSTGGFLSLLKAQEDGWKTRIRWMWLSSPLLKPTHGQAQAKIKAAKLMAATVPHLTIPTGARYEKCCHTKELAPGAFDRVFAGCHGMISTRFGCSLLLAEEQLNQTVLAFPFPVLVTQGDEDKICPPKFSVELIKRLQSPEKSLLYLDYLRHEPLKEPKLSNFSQNVRAWLVGKD